MTRFSLLPWVGTKRKCLPVKVNCLRPVGREKVNCPAGAREAGLGHDLGAPWQRRVQGSPLHAARPVDVPYKAAANMCPVRFIRRL